MFDRRKKRRRPMKTGAGFQGKGKAVASVKFRERLDNDAKDGGCIFPFLRRFLFEVCWRGGKGFQVN